METNMELILYDGLGIGALRVTLIRTSCGIYMQWEHSMLLNQIGETLGEMLRGKNKNQNKF